MRFIDLPNIEADCLAFSHDSRLLAAWAFGKVFLIDSLAGTVRALQAEGDGIKYGTPGVGFTPDDQGVIAFRNLTRGTRAAVHVYDVVSGKICRSIAGVGFEGMVPTSEGRLVYVAVRGDQSVQIVPWDTVSGKWRAGFGRHAGFLRELAVSANGNWVAGFNKQEIRIWNPTGGK